MAAVYARRSSGGATTVYCKYDSKGKKRTHAEKAMRDGVDVSTDPATPAAPVPRAWGVGMGRAVLWVCDAPHALSLRQGLWVPPVVCANVDAMIGLQHRAARLGAAGIACVHPRP